MSSTNNHVTVASLLADGPEFPFEVIDAVKALARSKPWKGTLEERKAKFQAANEALADACDVKPLSILFGDLNGTSSLRSAYRRHQRTIYLSGKLSVVTYLHLLAAAMGLSPLERFRWSLSLFAAYFPRSFARCRQDGLFLVR